LLKTLVISFAVSDFAVAILYFLIVCVV